MVTARPWASRLASRRALGAGLAAAALALLLAASLALRGGGPVSPAAPVAAGCNSIGQESAAAAVEAPRIFLVANNAAANASWGRVAVGPQDLLLFFNLAPPLEHFAGVPRAQKLLFANSAVMRTFGGFNRARAAALAAAVDRLVVLNESNNTRYATLAPANLPQLARFPHLEVLERGSRLMQDLYRQFPRYDPALPDRPWPSSGFLAFRYARAFFPLHRPALVGFTGQGHPRHDFALERRQYEEAGAQLL